MPSKISQLDENIAPLLNEMLAISDGADTKKISMQTLRATRTVVVAPLTATTVTIANGTETQIINPAGTIAALTIAFPAGVVDGQVLDIVFTQIVTSITTSGASLQFALTSAAVGDKKRYKWSTSLTKWV